MNTAVSATAMMCRTTMRDAVDLSLGTSIVLSNHVADAADGVDLQPRPAFGEVFAQTRDIDFDGIGGDVAGHSEDLVFDRFFGHPAALPAHQQLEHGGFSRREQFGPAVDEDLVALGVEY